MLHGRNMSSTPSPTAGNTGAVIRRLLRDYLSGQWGLLVLAVFCMLLTSAISGLVPTMFTTRVIL